jgi:hypothetical protein
MYMTILVHSCHLDRIATYRYCRGSIKYFFYDTLSSRNNAVVPPRWSYPHAATEGSQGGDIWLLTCEGLIWGPSEGGDAILARATVGQRVVQSKVVTEGIRPVARGKCSSSERHTEVGTNIRIYSFDQPILVWGIAGCELDSVAEGGQEVHVGCRTNRYLTCYQIRSRCLVRVRPTGFLGRLGEDWVAG